MGPHGPLGWEGPAWITSRSCQLLLLPDTPPLIFSSNMFTWYSRGLSQACGWHFFSFKRTLKRWNSEQLCTDLFVLTGAPLCKAQHFCYTHADTTDKSTPYINLLDQFLISKKMWPWILKRLSKTFGMQFRWKLNVEDILFLNLINAIPHCSRKCKKFYLFSSCLSAQLYIGVQGDSFVCW